MRMLPCLIAAAMLAAPSVSMVLADEPVPSTQPTTKPVDPKPLSDKVKKGLVWLAQSQFKDGGWGQGDDAQNVRGGEQQVGVANVADTCMAIQALMRSGCTPREGDYQQNILKGVDYVCNKVDAADKDSLWVTDVRGTRVQSKIGQYVDTFLAAQVLSDVKGKMPTDAENQRVAAMLDKTLRKIEKNQQKDGGFAQSGWAPTLGDGLASKAMNQAAARGEKVSEDALAKLDEKAKRDYDEKNGAVVSAGSASVELYARSSNSSSFANADIRYDQKQKDLEAVANNPTTQPAAREAAQKQLDELKGMRQEAHAAQAGAVARMSDKEFASGFGSNGGEEFLSYLNIGEPMVVRGDPKFADWHKAMTENLSRIQNDDGSWSGHHCITGKTFCTSSALMVLMVDRTQSPVVDALKKR